MVDEMIPESKSLGLNADFTIKIVILLLPLPIHFAPPLFFYNLL